MLIQRYQSYLAMASLLVCSGCNNAVTDLDCICQVEGAITLLVTQLQVEVLLPRLGVVAVCQWA